MTYRFNPMSEVNARNALQSESLLEKYAGLNWFDETYDNFEARLERGEFPVAAIKPWFLIRTYCVDCDAPAVAIRYHGRRLLLIDVEGYWRPHQCPYEIGPEEGRDEPTPEEEIDWSERRDIEEEQLKLNQWSDDTWGEPRSFADPVFGYPDIPYVDPTRGNHR